MDQISRSLDSDTGAEPNEGTSGLNRQSVTQDQPLPGSLQAAYKRCGRSNCRCAGGTLHGPYWYRHWRDGGRQRKAYVPMKELQRVADAIERYHELYPPLWPIRKALMDLARAYRAVEQGQQKDLI
jgi:uncharacterized protein DUF6788